ncbi:MULTISPECIES: SusC/RagA family TonB-linked outer membrane protein [Butyricimonas]|uniref:SusC/RagA family TonB-linked outer membrane protein n=1 Tax=Butyricimonas TaxID=574697 RepID=UPI0007FB225F|nr:MULTISPECIES: SusC/RagA family TonB-linked outer membrane protein [Butyricimonas]
MGKRNLYFLFRGDPRLVRLVKKMKLLVLFVMLSASTLWANVTAQEMKLDLRVEHKSLVEVIDLLKLKSGFSFIYSASDVEKISDISMDVQGKTLREILDMALSGTNLMYTIENELIILKRMTMMQQVNKRTVKGVVLGTSPKDTLPGVSVVVKGSTKGVTTDVHGKFTMVIPDGDDVVLVFSFVGKKKKEVKYTGQEMMRVVLEDEAQALEEVVINAGYQQIDKRKLTSAVTTLKMDDIMTPGMSTLDQMLEGRVPGMIFMQNSGQVGASPRLRIRGTSTVLGSQEPLWVIDGIIQEDPVNVDPAQLNDLDFVNLLGNAISGLNPEDIEQIDVLKDASATALYGTRAANGVIVITTKQGKEGPPQIRYSLGGTFSRRPRYSDRAVNVMNSAERVAYSRDVIEKGVGYKNHYQDCWIGYEEAYENYRNGLMTFEEYNDKVAYYESLNTDWFDVICRDAFSHKHTLSVSGGSKNMKYYVSVGYNRENGVLQKEKGDRYTANTNISLNYNRFNVQFKLGGNVQKQDHTPNSVGLMDYAYNASRAVPVFNEDGSYFFYPQKGTGSDVKVWYNILNERDHSYNKIDRNSLNFSTSINYNIFENLKLTGTFSYATTNTKDETYWGEETFYVKSLKKLFTSKDNEKDLDAHLASSYYKSQTLIPYGGELSRNETKNENYMARLQVQYNLYLDEARDHLMTFMGGWELSSSNYTGLDKTFRNYLPDRGMLIGNFNSEEYGEYTKWYTTNSKALGVLKDQKTNRISAYGAFNYSYQNRYIFNANMRVDYSNAFGDRARDKFLPIWSASGRWNIKEDILSDSWWVNELALKLSYGWQGTTHASMNPDLVMTQGGANLAFGGDFGSSIKSFPNPDLEWEKTNSINASIDFSLFKNKLNGSLSYYYKKTKDAFLTKKVSAVNGVSSYMVNEGTVENQGLEVSLNINPVNTAVGGNRKGFSWRIDPQLGQVVNKLLNKVLETDKYDPMHDDYVYTDYLNGTAHISGKPLNSFYSYEFAGLSPDDGRPTFARIGEEYFEQYVDMKDSEVYTTVMKYSGCRVPYLQGGINNTFSWNGFVLNFNLAYSIGSKIRLLKLYNPEAATMAYSPIQNIRKEMTKRWQHPGDEKYTNIPGVLGNTAYQQTLTDVWWSSETYDFGKNIWEMYNYADIRVVSGNYLKLQSLNLRYVFPDSVCKKLNLSSLYVSLSGTNLFTWSAKELKGQDPTSQSGSADKISVGVAPTYTLSVNLAF